MDRCPRCGGNMLTDRLYGEDSCLQCSYYDNPKFEDEPPLPPGGRARKPRTPLLQRGGTRIKRLPLDARTELLLASSRKRPLDEGFT